MNFYREVKDHPRYKAGDKVVCIYSVPDINVEVFKCNCMPKNKMVLTIQKVTEMTFEDSKIYFTFLEIIQNKTDTRPAFPETLFIPYNELTDKEKDDHKIYYFNVN